MGVVRLVFAAQCVGQVVVVARDVGEGQMDVELGLQHPQSPGTPGQDWVSCPPRLEGKDCRQVVAVAVDVLANIRGPEKGVEAYQDIQGLQVQDIVLCPLGG